MTRVDKTIRSGSLVQDDDGFSQSKPPLASCIALTSLLPTQRNPSASITPVAHKDFPTSGIRMSQIKCDASVCQPILIHNTSSVFTLLALPPTLIGLPPLLLSIKGDSALTTSLTAFGGNPNLLPFTPEKHPLTLVTTHLQPFLGHSKIPKADRLSFYDIFSTPSFSSDQC
jgi:hypothetical protein